MPERVSFVMAEDFRELPMSPFSVKLSPCKSQGLKGHWCSRWKKSNSVFKRYGSLGPRLRDDGVIAVGERAKNHMQFSYSQEVVPLLPNNCHFTKLYAQIILSEGHNGASATMAKIS